MKKQKINVNREVEDGCLSTAICRTLDTHGEFVSIRGRKYFADFKNEKMYRVENIYRFNYLQRCDLIEVDLLDSYYAKKANDFLAYKQEDFRVKKGEAKRVDYDLYVWDPCKDTRLTLGRMGDGWVCIVESFFEFEFEPEEPEEEEGGDVEIPTEEPQEEIDDTVVAVSYTDCYGQPQLAETPISPEERAKIEGNMIGRPGNHGVEITWAILSTINRQANNTCWQYHFETNTGTVFV
jgi:hypothetical protein